MTRFRLIAETSSDAPTNAEAKSWWSDRIALDDCPYTVEISAEEETAKPHLGESHPAAVCSHALMEAQRKLMGVGWEGDVKRLVDQALDAHARLFQLFIRTERVLEEVRAREVRLALELAADRRLFKQVEAKNANLAARHNQARAALVHVTELLAPHPVSFAPRGVEPNTNTAPVALEIAR